MPYAYYFTLEIVWPPITLMSGRLSESGDTDGNNFATSKTTSPSPAVDPNRVDSEVRFAGLPGQVEVRPGNDEDAWDFAKMGMVLYCEDHIRTGPRSSAIISFKDLSTFVMKADTEIVQGKPSRSYIKIERFNLSSD